MNCSRELIEGYLDEELDPGLKAQVEEHLVTCPGCSTTYSQIREQQAAIRSLAPHYAAPARLEQSVRVALGKAARGGREADASSVPWRWLAIAASVLLAVSLVWNLRLQSRPAEREMIAQNILSSHVRSLIGTHLLDVTSSDRHTVKPWFNGKLDYSPEVKDFASQGFPLIGGRIEYVADRPVAALIYQRRQHVINLFTWPSTASDAKKNHFTRNGYNVVHWSNASMTFWAVSDLAMPELQQFQDLYAK